MLSCYCCMTGGSRRPLRTQENGHTSKLSASGWQRGGAPHGMERAFQELDDAEWMKFQRTWVLSCQTRQVCDVGSCQTRPAPLQARPAPCKTDPSMPTRPATHRPTIPCRPKLDRPSQTRPAPTDPPPQTLSPAAGARSHINTITHKRHSGQV